MTPDAATDASSAAPARVDWSSYRAVLFDLDGVLTPTAELHQLAWATMFERYLTEHQGPDHPPYTSDDYLRFIDGKPRFDGVRSFLASRGVALPEGDPSDPAGDASVSALGNRKNEVFNELLRREGIVAYPGSVVLLDALRAVGTAVAVVSSSRNAREVLVAADLADRFSVVVDGVVAAERHIAGKPAPDMFLVAAEQLGATADESVVVEDAISGVLAAAAGGFALVIGVDRGAGPDVLRRAGADLVVGDLGELVPGGSL